MVQFSSIFPFILLSLCCCYVRLGKSWIVPNHYDGFVYGGVKSVGKPAVVVEAFLDPVCPDSRDTWQPLKQAIGYYNSSSISLIVHPFPLPYHDNSYMTCRALHAANMLNASATFRLLELFFEQQESFYNAPTHDMSRESVMNKVAKLSVVAVGGSLSAFQSALMDSKSDAAARVSFKYGCLRGVTGTPFFLVNGFPLPDPGYAVDYNKWRSILDRLMDTHPKVDGEDLVSYI